jgi:hypothetical protein
MSAGRSPAKARFEVRLVFVHISNEGSEDYEAAFVEIDQYGEEVAWGHTLRVHPDQSMELVSEP